MKNYSKIFLCTLLAVALGACAAKSNTIQPAYVSPLQYQDYSCKQIRNEMARISRRVNEVSGVQDKQASKDSVALGVGLVLFWPALFFMIGDDQKEELSRLKGEYDALEQAANAKECDVSREIENARRMEQERLDAEKEQQENNKQNYQNESFNLLHPLLVGGCFYL